MSHASGLGSGGVHNREMSTWNGDLRAAGEPVREAALFERVRARGAGAGVDLFVACREELEANGHVPMRVEPPDIPRATRSRSWARCYWPAG